MKNNSVNKNVFLHQAISERFNKSELKLLSEELGIEFENLPNASGPRIEVSLDIVDFMVRQQRLPELIQKCKEERPHIKEWETFIVQTPTDDAALSTEPPFKGLYPYHEIDGDQFYSREEETAQLHHHLQHNHFLAVIGPSGVGKSSLVQAGLIHSLNQGASLSDTNEISPDKQEWLTHTITLSDNNPLKDLAGNLTQEIVSETARNTLMDELLSDPRSFDLQAQKLLGREEMGENGRFLLIIDQFERAFVSNSEQEEQQIWQQGFIDNLMYSVSKEASGQVAVIIVLRADFYHMCAQYPELYQHVVNNQVYLGEIPKSEIEEAILALAQNGGWSFESGLVKQILRHMSADSHNTPESRLPLLSHVLYETWQKREDRQLTFIGYRESGTLTGAVAKTADTSFSKLTPAQQRIAQKVFLKLVEITTDGKYLTRQITWTNLNKIDENPNEIETVVEIFVKGQLIWNMDNPLTLTHEAVITHWPRLQQWLIEAKESERIKQQLLDATDKWILNNRHNRTLYQGLTLFQAQKWIEQYGDQLEEREKSFIEKSEQIERRKKLLLRSALIGGVLIALLLIAGFFFNARTSDQQAAESIRQTGVYQLAAAATATAAEYAVETIQSQSSRSVGESGQTINTLYGQLTSVHDELTAVAYTPTPTPTGILIDQYETENNQTPYPIASGDENRLCNASLYPTNDTDRFIFAGKTGSTYTVATDQQAGVSRHDLDTFITVYDREDNEIISNDDVAQGTRWSEVTFTAPEDNLYIVEITNLSPVDTANKPYCIYVNEKIVAPTPSPTPPGIGDVCEVNESFEQACLIGEYVNYNLNFFPIKETHQDAKVDIDYFVFRVQAGGTYRCETIDLSPYNDTELTIYSQDREEIIGSNDDREFGNSSSVVDFIADYKGEVYIVVQSFFPPKYEEAMLYTYTLQCTSISFPTPPPTPAATDTP